MSEIFQFNHGVAGSPAKPNTIDSGCTIGEPVSVFMYFWPGNRKRFIGKSKYYRNILVLGSC
ncbi:hypothetical protein GJV56_13005 [Elizabethkingia anophelis]|nr:hypothetical protein GJV56_13005 [Elizabethkingia anophelis]QNV10166.1 hypothetical protein EIY88_12970 [Elizabethkingia anophelis]